MIEKWQAAEAYGRKQALEDVANGLIKQKSWTQDMAHAVVQHAANEGALIAPQAARCGLNLKLWRTELDAQEHGREAWESKYPKAALTRRADGQYSDELLEANWQGYLRAIKQAQPEPPSKKGLHWLKVHDSGFDMQISQRGAAAGDACSVTVDR